MNWIKVQVAGIDKMINMDQYKELKADPGDSSKCILTHNDASTVTIDTSYNDAVIFFSPLFYKQDALLNPL